MTRAGIGVPVSNRLRLRPTRVLRMFTSNSTNLCSATLPLLGDSNGTPWVYGWTHYKTVGQTQARLNQVTRDVEIRDCRKWIRCIAGSDEFFTPDFTPTIPASKAKPMMRANGGPV